MLKTILKNKKYYFYIFTSKNYFKKTITTTISDICMNVGGWVIAFGSLKWLRSPYHEWLKRVLNMASQYMSK